MARIEYVAVLRAHIVIASYGNSSPDLEQDILKLLPATTHTEQLISAGHLFSFFPHDLSHFCMHISPVC
jgi:hypothetical protein